VIAPTQADDATETKQGTDSVATKGQPAAPQTITRLTATPETPVEARFRSSTDEYSEGGATPEAAAERDPAASDSKSSGQEASGSKRSDAPRLTIKDLRPGQWIEVDATASGDLDAARRIRILRPIGGPDTPAAEAKPE